MKKTDLCDVVSRICLVLTMVSLLFVTYLLLRMYVVLSFHIPTDSMKPAIEPGDNILAAQVHRPGKVKRGDVVFFRFPYPEGFDHICDSGGVFYAKRCIGLPGDTLEIRRGHYKIRGINECVGDYESQDRLRRIAGGFPSDSLAGPWGASLNAWPGYEKPGWTILEFGPLMIPSAGTTIDVNEESLKLYRNAIEWEIGRKLAPSGDTTMTRYTFRKNYCFVGGDNVENSQDSRYWGLLPESMIKARGLFVWKSVDPSSGKRNWHRIGKRIRCRSDVPTTESVVLSHFKGKGLRYEAAKYLLDGMKGNVSYDPSQRFSNHGAWKVYSQKYEKSGKCSVAELYRLRDSLSEEYSAVPDKQRRLVADSDLLDSDFLINHIESRFKAWEQSPYRNRIPFESFLSDILPYKTGLSFWAGADSLAEERYRTTADYASSVAKNYEEYVSILYEKIRGDFMDDGSLFRTTSWLSPFTCEDYMRAMLGTCMEENCTVISVLRHFGIPASLLSLPNWGNSDSRHYWTDIAGIERRGMADNRQHFWNPQMGEPINNMYWLYFDGVDTCSLPKGVQVISNRTVPKVFRHSFSSSPSLEDVTSQYVLSKDVSIPIERRLGRISGRASLACFDLKGKGWIPVAETRISKGNALFNDMGVNIVYTLMLDIKDVATPVSFPFLLRENGEMKVFKPDTVNTTTLLARNKMPFRGHVLYYAYTMVGGRFEIGMDLSLRNTDILFSIDSIPFYGQSVPLVEHNCGRYVLFRFPKNSKLDLNCHYFIAEMKVYGLDESGNEVLLKGVPVGNAGQYGGELCNAFDGDRLSFAWRNPSDKRDYIGIDLGGQKSITRIEYFPRSDDNGVVEGEEYELLCWDGRQWKSMGRRIGRPDGTVYYDTVPSNAIFRLRNLTRGVEENIFTADCGRQVYF